MAHAPLGFVSCAWFNMDSVSVVAKCNYEGTGLSKNVQLKSVYTMNLYLHSMTDVSSVSVQLQL